jgi:LysM repeat protein
MNPLARLALLALTYILTAPVGAQPLATNATITVQAGDTLDAIARKQGISVAALIKLNPNIIPDRLAIGTILQIPSKIISQNQPLPPELNTKEASASLLLSAAERRDRAQQMLVDPNGWRWYGNTAVDWKGWRLHPGGVRITLVKPNPIEVGNLRSLATAVAVQCDSLRQTWRIDGQWEPWKIPSGGTVPARIVLDLCSNTTDAPAVPVLPLE